MEKNNITIEINQEIEDILNEYDNDFCELVEEEPELYIKVIDYIKSQINIGDKIESKEIVSIDQDTIDVYNTEFDHNQTMMVVDLIGKIVEKIS